jgi:hypothetical protein
VRLARAFEQRGGLDGGVVHVELAISGGGRAEQIAGTLDAARIAAREQHLAEVAPHMCGQMRCAEPLVAVDGGLEVALGLAPALPGRRQPAERMAHRAQAGGAGAGLDDPVLVRRQQPVEQLRAGQVFQRRAGVGGAYHGDQPEGIARQIDETTCSDEIELGTGFLETADLAEDVQKPAAPRGQGDIRGVNIALGNAPLSDCASFDADHDGMVAINELIAAVNNALGGC